MDLYLIRHPPVAIQAGTCYGSTDVGLLDTPHAGAKVIAAKLGCLGSLGGTGGTSGVGNTGDASLVHSYSSSLTTARVWTSPLRRCRTVAEALVVEALHGPSDSDASTTTPLVDPRLSELDFGKWEGVAWDAVPRAELDAWAADIVHARPHGGESVAMLAERTAGWLAALDNEAADSLHMAITHAGTIRVMTAQALQLPLLNCLNWSIDLRGICHLTRPNAQAPWAMAAWNL